MQNITENVVNKTAIDDMGVNNNVESLKENIKVPLIEIIGDITNIKYKERHYT